MARTPKPWWWKDRNAYYTTIGGKHFRLGTNLKTAKDILKNKLSADAALPRVASGTFVCVVLEGFLAWTSDHRAKRTYEGYKAFLDSFYATYPDLTTDKISTADVTAWLASQNWKSTTQRNAITALQRAFNWAVKNDNLPHNPIRGMEKPSSPTRTDTITIKEFLAILRHSKSKNFRRLLIFCWDCGCRPQEARAIQPRHVELSKHRCVFPADEGKGKKTRAIYMPTARSLAYVKSGMKQKYIFLNDRGRPWTMWAVNSQFARLAAKDKLGKRYHLYALRHSWITRKLKAGVDSHVVAKLSGHCNTKMIDEVYSHVADDPTFMLEQASREKH